MNPKIKEALSNSIQKDEETERICTFIADFIKEYGYHLTEGNTIYFRCVFLGKGQAFNGKRVRYNTIFLYNPHDMSMSKEFITKFTEHTWYDILKKEGAKINCAEPSTVRYPDKMEVRFTRS